MPGNLQQLINTFQDLKDFNDAEHKVRENLNNFFCSEMDLGLDKKEEPKNIVIKEDDIIFCPCCGVNINNPIFAKSKRILPPTNLIKIVSESEFKELQYQNILK